MVIFEKGELKQLWPFYLESFIGYLFPIFLAFMTIYFLNIGLTVTQIGFLTSIMALFIFIFEIPTGAIADLYGRKFSVILGFFLEGVLLLSIYFFNSYTQLLIIFSFLGFAITLSSGAKESWVIDSIDKKFSKAYFMKSRSISAFAMIFSGILGSLLVKEYGLSIIWPVSSISFFMSIAILIFVKEKFQRKKVNIIDSFRKVASQTKESINYSKKHPVIFFMMLAAFFGIISMAFSESLAYTPFLVELSFPNYAFGYLWSSLLVMAVIAPLLSKRLAFMKSDKRFILFFLSLMTFVLFFVIFVNEWIGLLLILLISTFLAELVMPIKQSYFHKFIPTKMRATITSVKGMIISFAAIIAYPCAGWFVDNVGARESMLLSAILMIPALISYWLINEKKEKN